MTNKKNIYIKLLNEPIIRFCQATKYPHYICKYSQVNDKSFCWNRKSDKLIFHNIRG